MRRELISELLAEITGLRRHWTFTPLHGGDTSNVCLLSSGAHRLVLKYSERNDTPGIFRAESAGLALLRKHCPSDLLVPEVMGWKESEGVSILVLEYLENRPAQPGFWRSFGRSLAGLHLASAEGVGLEESNYIAVIPQDNTPQSSWPEFFANRRIRPMARLAERQLGTEIMTRLEVLCERMHEWMPGEFCSWLHGDLWSGNYLCLGEKSALIDPAVYKGSREMDLAMTRLFGGFPDEFYQAYMEVFPLTEGWEERVDLCNLYPVLVHVNLFGAGYVSQLGRMLSKYV